MRETRSARLRLAIGSVSAVAALVLAGCSSGEADDPPADDPQQTETAPEPTETDFPTLPVGEPFGQASWGVQVVSAGGAEGSTPIVTGERLIVLSGPNVHAYDASGQQVWSATPEVLEGTAADPILRLVDDETVALISQGESTGEGLDADGYAARVTLWSLASGDEIATVDVPGTQSDGPDVSRFGLAFVHPDGHAIVIRPDGSTEELADAGSPSETDSSEWADQIVVVSETVLVRGEDGTYSADGWDTSSTAPADASSTDIRGVIGSDALVVRWYSGQGAEGEESGAILDAATGEVLAPIEGCVPEVAATATASPSGEFAVLDSLLWDGETATCVGGGDSQREVVLTAVSDEGTAYGSAGDSLLAEVPAEGEPTTSDLTDGARPPIGIMGGGLAIHYDGEGILTANPIGG